MEKLQLVKAAIRATRGPAIGYPSPGTVVYFNEILIVEMDARKILFIQERPLSLVRIDPVVLDTTCRITRMIPFIAKLYMKRSKAHYNDVIGICQIFLPDFAGYQTISLTPPPFSPAS